MISPLRIAVADDEEDLRDYFRESLSRLGHRVVASAPNGRELVEQCRAVAPDLVITDIKMPELDGIDAALQLYRERQVPIILVSSYYDSALLDRAEAAPVQAYLVKPIRRAEWEPALTIARRRFEQVQSLEAALAKVKQLQGLLPMCMYCKKVRDDRNYWLRVEAYIAQHSEARFSHGICPECYAGVVKPELEQRQQRLEESAKGNP